MGQKPSVIIVCNYLTMAEKLARLERVDGEKPCVRLRAVARISRQTGDQRIVSRTYRDRSKPGSKGIE